MVKDFNKEFWAILGVNKRVFEAADVFNIKRDIQANEKEYDRYLNYINGNDVSLSTEVYLKIQMQVKNCFEDLFLKYLFGSTDDVYDEACFYLNQILNTAINCQCFSILNLKQEKYINMFAFQIFLVINYMRSLNINTTTFEEAIEKESIKPFVKRAKEALNIKTNKDLATELSFKQNELNELMDQKSSFKLEEISSNSYASRISEWRRNKSIPTFYQCLIFNNLICSKLPSKQHKRASLIQVVLTRVLLAVQKKYNIDKSLVKKFKEKLQYLLKEFDTSNFKIILALQSSYLIDFSSIYSRDDLSLDNKLKLLKEKTIAFEKFAINENDIKADLKIPDANALRKKFENCKFQKVVEELECINYSDNIIYHKQKVLLLVLAAIKIKDKKLLKKYMEDLDRFIFGCYLSINNVKISFDELINNMEQFSTFKQCSEELSKYLNQQYKLSTSE